MIRSSVTVVLLAGMVSGCVGPAACRVSEPVIECGRGDPTQDKPQSKLWYAHGHWWAWLPATDGGRVWRRDCPGRWRALWHLDEVLAALPARADVWRGEGRIVAALVTGRRLAVASLKWCEATSTYEVASPPLCWQEQRPVETVTIDRGADGAFWAAYPRDDKRGRSIVVRRCAADLSSPPGEPVVLAEGLGGDEVCGVAAFDGSVAVLWSDQRLQTLWLRRLDGPAPGAGWTPAEAVAAGNFAADDHINFCRPRGAAAPRLMAVTKTSLDLIGAPIFALHTLTRQGWWRLTPLGLLTSRDDLTRPIVVWTGGRPVVAYTRRNMPRKGADLGGEFSVIARQAFSPDGRFAAGPPRDILRAARCLNNVTGPKACPAGVAPLLLASDPSGGVYEVVLDCGD